MALLSLAAIVAPAPEIQALQKAPDAVEKPKDVKADAPPRATGYRPSTPAVKQALHAERLVKHKGRMASLVRATTPPAEFDAADMGWAGDPGDQADCGSCYLYSTCKTATTAFVKSGYGKVNEFRLATQYGMDCHNFGGCNGGNGTEVIDWMVKNGWPAESYVTADGQQHSDYPAYQARSGQCRLPANAKKWFPKDWLFITDDQSDKPAPVENYKAAIMAYGRVNVALDAGGQFSNYSGGVITSLGRSIDHEINVRGWSDAKQAFLLENQWSGWGGAKEKGDSCAWLSYKAVAALQDPFVVSAVPLPPPPPGPNAPVVTSSSASAQVGAPFTYQIVASNTPTSYGASGLPTGLTVQATTGVISGSPTGSGVYPATVTATNTAGTGTGTLSLTVGTGPPPSPVPVGTQTIALSGFGKSDGVYEANPVGTASTIMDIRRQLDVLFPPLVPPPPSPGISPEQAVINKQQEAINQAILKNLEALNKAILGPGK
jgi:C1A family cysteine protease